MNALLRHTALWAACLVQPVMAWAQPIIPNPLVRPGAAAASAPAAPPPPPSAPSGRRGDRGEGGSDVAGENSEPPSIPAAIQERVSGLYVAAIVGKAAVLRSQLAVAQVVFSNGAGGSGSSGANAAAGSGGGGSSGAQGGGGRAGAGVSDASSRGVFRAPSYIVRHGQIVDFIDRYRVVARVTSDTVVLYLLPADNAEQRQEKVVFRGSIDSVISSPPMPLASALEAPDGGLDGKAWRALSSVSSRGFNGSSRSDSGAAAPAANGRPSVSGR